MAYPADDSTEGSPNPAQMNKQVAKELERVNRALRTLSAGNRTLLRASDEQELLHDMCLVIVEKGGYRLASVAYMEHDEQKSIRWMACVGIEKEFLQTLHYTWADTKSGRTATGTAIRTGKPSVGRNLLTDPGYASYAGLRADAIKSGYASATAFPLRVEGQVLGALVMAAVEPDAFDEAEVNLLSELADDLAYGIANLRTRIKHQEAEARIRRLVESNIIGIFFWDLAGNVTEANDAVLQMVGYSRQELLSGDVRWASMTPLEHRAADARAIEELRQSGTCTPYEKEFIRKDGSRVPVLVFGAFLEGSQERGAAFVLDLTERKQAEAERQARQAAQTANQAKSEFLASMSHELRSPLNAILGFAQLMASDSPPPTSSQQESIDQILRAGWHLLALINEVLDLAKIESGQVSLSEEPLSLAESMLECQGMIEPQAQQRGIRMRFPEFDLPCFVHGDRIRVKQILINLLSNAIKYNREQGTVEVKCAPSTPDRMRISVRDTGVGLPPEKLAQLFQPFNRLGQETGAEEGTGIGLVVTKRLVELMGGAIGVESTVGVGSMFWFELASTPAPRCAAGGAESAALATAQVQNGASLHTLLYVEDNPTNLKLVEKLIARHTEMHLLTAVTGHLGIALARTAQPEVIVMDINLPDISGIDALKILRDDPATAHIPVIALSANAMPRDIEKGLKAGFFRYVTKPIKLDAFMDALNMALEFAQVNQRH